MGINEYIKIGKRIRKLRMKKGFSQKEMAMRCGIPYSTYSNYENNNREPSMQQLEKIANALEVTTDELINNSKKIDEETIHYIDHYTYQVLRLLTEKDKLCEQQIELDRTFDASTDKARLEYAVNADFVQFTLGRTLSDLFGFKDALLKTLKKNKLSLPYEILFALAKINPEGEKRILEEIDNLSYNPKYKVTCKPDDWDAFDEYDNFEETAADQLIQEESDQE